MNMNRLSLPLVLSDFTNLVGKILLLITQEQVGNCCGDVNGVILDRHQYRRKHNLAPWMLPTKAQLYYPMIWLWQAVSLKSVSQAIWPSSHGSQCEPLHWLKCFSGDPLGSWIRFQIPGFDWSSHPRWCWPKCHLISGLAQLWLKWNEIILNILCSLVVNKAVEEPQTVTAVLLSISPNLHFQWKKDSHARVLGNVRHYLTIVLAYFCLLPYNALIVLQHRWGQVTNSGDLSSLKECFQGSSPVDTGV